METKRTSSEWLLAGERREQIVRLLRNGPARGSDLARTFGVSAMTIRRDADALVAAGRAERERGGLRAARRPTALEPEPHAKALLHRAEKRRIAHAVRALVQPGASVGIGAGTTALAVAEAIGDVERLTVVTNAIGVAQVLRASSATVVLLGGERTPSDALVGPIANAAAATLSLDAVVLGAHALDPERGCTTPNLAEAETNRALLRAGRMRIVAADGSKWDELGLATFATLDELDVLVTTAVPAAASATVRRAVPRLVIA